jgi:hypothetical protein
MNVQVENPSTKQPVTKTYIVKKADVLRDREIILEILKKNRSRENYSYEDRYDWIYLRNPDGNAIPWIIWNQEKGIPVGFTAVFPRRVLVEGKEEVCWNCGDFSIETKYRSLGVALQLRREAKKEVEGGKVDFLYAHPNDKMAVIHLKAGHERLGFMKRYALPLRIDDYLQTRFQNRLLFKIMTLPGNLLLNMNLLFRKQKHSLDYTLHQIPKFETRHTDIFYEFAKKHRIIGIRDTVYLNWKYLDNPNYQYSLVEFYYKDKFVGYVLFSDHDSVVGIVECIVHPEEFVYDALLLFIKLIRKAFPGKSSISTVTFENNYTIPFLRKLNFQYRDDATSSVITYANPDSGLKDFIYNKDSWFMSIGDRDA